MPRMALGVAYDGSFWQGWQTQPNGRTVQDTLESALSQFLAQPVATICAGRTDTGVHALGQVVHIDTTAERRVESWVRGLNALLPDSIAVQWAQSVPDRFHARFSAKSRTYLYLVRNTRVRSPMMQGRAGWVYHALDLDRMRDAAERLVGEHDFSCFRSSQCQAASPVRTLHALQVDRYGDFFLFRFKANAFLHHMIRNLMGALLYIGQNRQEPTWIDQLLSQRDRRMAAPTFAPDGLYLGRVDYPEEFQLPEISSEAAIFSHLGFSS
ncbi:tRNA pseudouridine(38-40) synthase TruA [Candidimonas sp. SYP-B2681]|uniref:tRNA pseudouridine(38-40) synthase TruA n=1 Tax=Candidimonas sp. SYP-B2681 TaxID=2497686 RepID=UPI000F860F26|nr:tRNA pseudouridine(38-40) synthase TruA [Candidimonas sp. SYP-B2681]RTZ39295.1 tRNA pseudouridine(38-40) synthase TruA [Candidimonas sp. SYP-B2681]